MSDVVIVPDNDGPLHVTGPIKILTEGGRDLTKPTAEVWLCRCGQSSKKPFCDGTHRKVGFKSNLDTP